MDSFVQGWRALVWGRVWWTVLALTLAWSIGVGLALRAVTPRTHYRDCWPTPPQPLVTAPVDWLWLPLHALAAAPFGLYVSGLQFGLAAFILVAIPAALLQQGTARRIFAVPVVIGLGIAVMQIAWYHEVGAVRTWGLPAMACWGSGF